MRSRHSRECRPVPTTCPLCLVVPKQSPSVWFVRSQRTRGDQSGRSDRFAALVVLVALATTTSDRRVPTPAPAADDGIDRTDRSDRIVGSSDCVRWSVHAAGRDPGAPARDTAQVTRFIVVRAHHMIEEDLVGVSIRRALTSTALARAGAVVHSGWTPRKRTSAELVGRQPRLTTVPPSPRQHHLAPSNRTDLGCSLTFTTSLDSRV